MWSQCCPIGALTEITYCGCCWSFGIPQNLQFAVATMIENCSSLDSRLCEVRGRRPQIFAARAQSSRSAATDLRSPDQILEIGGHRSSQPGPNPRPRHRCRCKPRWWGQMSDFHVWCISGLAMHGIWVFLGAEFSRANPTTIYPQDPEISADPDVELVKLDSRMLYF